MATTTQTVALENPPPASHGPEYELRELRELRSRDAAPFGAQRPEVSPVASVPQQPQALPLWLKVKLIGVGFSFFCAGVNDGTLGPLIPYIFSTFHIGTGEVAIIYAATFGGWLVAAVTNPLLAAYLTLGQLLFLGAAFQLLAQCLRPWAPLPLFCVTFLLQALGMAYQDAHGNTFVSSASHVAYRWLGFIHAMYALGCLLGPLVATAIASSASDGVPAGGPAGQRIVGKGGDGWLKTYYVLLGLGVVNLVVVAVGFASELRTWGSAKRGDEEGALAGAEGEQGRKTSRAAMGELLELLKVKDVWIISMFYFFELGATFTAGGWVVEFLTTVRHGDLARTGYVPTGFYAGVFLGRILLSEPTFRFGEKRMILIYSGFLVGLQLVFWLVPNIIADATALSLMGFFSGPFFATGVSVASRLFPRKIQAAALSFVFVVAQAGGAVFPSVTGLIATRAGVQVLQPIVLALLVVGGACWWMVPRVPERSESQSN